MILLAVLLFLAPGCSSLLPSSKVIAKSKWHSYGEAEADFDRITPGATATNELAALGFAPSVNPNVRILTYLDVIQRFMPNQSISKDDLDPSVRAFIEGRERGQAWEVDVSSANSKRYGSVLLDLTGFVKKSHDTGWQFKGLLLIREGRVVYKLSAGLPNIDRYDKKVRPLGPLQELDSILARSAQSLW
jgi:uncharacterized protein (DUF736 family)